ncbi:MAG: DUF1800 family protein [Verrucomicrobia bacterium]|nr:DUF1800 family protein [Verrucomicrobiota bacterium]
MKTFFPSVLFALAFAVLAIVPASAQRLSNLSTRTQVGTGANVTVVGFVVGQGSNKNVLIRAIGPTIAAAPFNVPGTISDPKIDLADASGRILFTNDNWGTTVAPAAVATSATFASVGAFNLTTGSRDAAVLASNLAPGSYTATVSGVGTASGVALVEVYDVTGAARLMNLSTRAQVGTGSGIIISGLVISPGAGRRQILVRAAGPALTGFGVPGALADPVIAIVNNAAPTVQIASNDNWSSGTNVTSLNSAFTQAGAFGFASGSKDAAVIADLAPGSYSIQVSGVGDTTGLALVEVYDITADSVTTVGVVASNPTTDTKGAAPGVFTFTRTGSTAAPLTAYYQVGGSAVAGVDYTALSGSVTFPAGVSSLTVNLSPRTDGASDTISRIATLSLAPGSGYSIGEAASVASVTIFYNPGTNYIAALRTPSSAPNSTAFGTATIQLSGDSKFAIVNVNFSSLSSPQTVAYLRIGNPGEVGTEVLRLPPGQFTGQRWDFPTAGELTSAAILQAIRDGRLFLSIESANYPAGELKGTFIQNTATLAFTPPAAPPALPDAPLTAAEAARFLVQATFGPNKAEIDALTGKRMADLNTWITAQMALPASSLRAATLEDFTTITVLSDNPQLDYRNRQAAWWKTAVTAPDQLRLRVAFALSQILVVSDVPTQLYQNPLAMANYYDLLATGAFGNFRQLIENVSLSPVMGLYLSSLRNAKATFEARTGAVLTSPDENYAREIMQLFTIGLNQLQPDGTLKLDPSGVPIPTYDQKTITEVAKVFTGWAFASDTTNANNFRGAAANYISPMVLFPTFHEDGAKTIFNGIQIPANQGGAKDLKDLLDALVNHANTGPFISRQLIQRLVTSNPSPGYVYRVAQVFANDGTGTRGNLGAVVRAILTDYEARSSSVAATASFGKLKEPVLRATGLLRAVNGGSNLGRFSNAPFFVPAATESALAQTPLHSPTVFNFFEPNFVAPGALAAAGLYAPEYQVLNDTTAISQPNQLWNFIYATRSATNTIDTTVGLQLDSLLPLARTPAALVDQVNLLLAAGGLPKNVTDRLTAAITAMPVGTGATFTTANDIERVRSALYLTISVPHGAIQK